MKLPVPFRRLAYRLAYRGLRVWWFVARPAVAGVKCVLADGDRVLLVRHTYGPAHWDLPGGSIKRREAPVHAARREIDEELGLRIEDWEALGTVTGRMDHRRDTPHCFRAQLSSPRLTLDPGEIATAQWFPRSELPPRLAHYVRPILSIT